MRRGLVIALVWLAASSAQADAIGQPPVVDCPPGGRSSVARPMTHQQFAYCAPALCSPQTPCATGSHCALVDVTIGERAVPQGYGGHGIMPPGPPGISAHTPPPPPPPMLAEVLGACDAGDHEALEPRTSGTGLELLSGPTTAQVPSGCQRIHACVADAAVTPPPVAPAPPPPPPSAPPPAAPPPAAPAAPTHSGCSVAFGPTTGMGAVPSIFLAMLGTHIVRRRRAI